jgi:hypothetical protein
MKIDGFWSKSSKIRKFHFKLYSRERINEKVFIMDICAEGYTLFIKNNFECICFELAVKIRSYGWDFQSILKDHLDQLR